MLKTHKQNNLYYIVIALVITIFFSADRFLKLVALNLKTNQTFKLIDNLFIFHFSANPYLAFSLPFNGLIINILITLVSLLLFSYILYLLYKKPEDVLEIALFSAILIGAFSNLWDRFNYGYVIDYLEIKNFTIFNIADLMISLSSLFLIIKNLKNNEKKEKKKEILN